MLDRRGFSVYRPRPGPRRAWRLFVAASLGVCSIGALVFPAEPPAPRDSWTRTRRFVSTPQLSDLGYPVQFRPDERTAAGIPIKAGNVWDQREIGHLSNLRLVQTARRVADRALRAYCGSDAAARACRMLALYLRILGSPLQDPGHWFDGQAQEWAWLFNQGAAGWRSLEWSIERGRSARDHWDIHRGLIAGFSLNAVGFTEYTQSLGGTTYYVSATGLNTNTGLSPSSPLLTPGAAAALMDTGSDDWCLFKSADTFTDDGTGATSSVGLANIAGFVNKRGVSPANPLRFDRYGTGARPKFDIKQKDQWIQCRSGTANLHIGSLEIYSSNNVGTGTAGTGITLSDNFTDGQIENCYIHEVASGISIVSFAGHPDRVTIRRNVIQKNFYLSLAQVGVGIFCQGFTEGLLIEENLLDHNGHHPTYGGKNEFRHNLYVTDTNQGYTCRRNISTRACNHGLGRCHGKVYHNIVQDCPTAILFAEDATHYAGVSDEIYQNSIIGRALADAAADLAAGISVYQGIQATTTETLLDVYDNTIANYAVDGSGMTVYGITAGQVATVGGTLRVRLNCFHDVHNTSNTPTAAIRLNAGSWTHVLTDNKFSTSGQMVWQFGSLATAGYTLTATGNQYYSPAGVANTFYTQASGLRTYAQWVSAVSETGSSFTDPSFPDPTRDLAAYNAVELGGVGTLAAAITQLQSYDLDTWDNDDHGVYPRLNYIRGGFGLAAVDDPYEGTSEPPPPPTEEGDATPVLPGLWGPPAPATSGESYWGADGEWHDPAATFAPLGSSSSEELETVTDQVRNQVVPLLDAVLTELAVITKLLAHTGNINDDLDRLRADAAAGPRGLDMAGDIVTNLAVITSMLSRVGNVPDNLIGPQGAAGADGADGEDGTGISVPSVTDYAGYSIPGVICTAAQNIATTASTVYYQPFVVDKTITVTAIAVRIGTMSATGGATSRLSIYAATNAWLPGALMVDAGTVAVDSTGVKAITGLTTVLTPGLYLLRVHADASASQPTYNGWRGSPYKGTLLGSALQQFPYQFVRAVAYAAAENPGTAWTGESTSTSPFIYYCSLQWTPT